MTQIAFLTWQWQPQGPLHTGYDPNLAEFTGRRQRGSRTSINLETHSDPQQLEPAFLASSVKGVFRQAAAWLIERTARQLGAPGYVTCDFYGALDDKYRRSVPPLHPPGDVLCPVCRVFGGSGCLTALGGGDSAGVQRRQSPVSFGFDDGNDAYHAEADFGPPYRFAWQQILNRGQDLRVEQLAQKEVTLAVRVEPASDLSLALLFLASDLISSGVFRFGRFTSRGYGIVRLAPNRAFRATLDQLLSDDTLPWQEISQESGFLAAKSFLEIDPMMALSNTIQTWQSLLYPIVSAGHETG